MSNSNNINHPNKKGGDKMEKKYLAFDTEFKADGEEGIIEGYAAFFNNIDSYNDVILPGAFKNISNVSDVKLFYNHEWHSVPIGTVMELYEDDRGLKFKAKFNKTALANDVKEAVKTGGVTKMSIGYSTKDSEFDKETGIRYLKEIDLFEISPVNFPANNMADIQSYKSEEFKSELRKSVEEFFKPMLNEINEKLDLITDKQAKNIKKQIESVENESKNTELSQIMAKLNEIK